MELARLLFLEDAGDDDDDDDDDDGRDSGRMGGGAVFTPADVSGARASEHTSARWTRS